MILIITGPMSHRVPDAPHEDMLKLLSVGRMADILPLNCNLTMFFDLIKI